MSHSEVGKPASEAMGIERQSSIDMPSSTDINPDKLVEPACVGISASEVKHTTEDFNPDRLVGGGRSNSDAGRERDENVLRTEIDEAGHKYFVDRLGRTVRVVADLSLVHREKLTIPNSVKEGKDYKIGDEKGHIIGDRFNGEPSKQNIVPMDARVNKSDYKTLENRWASALKDGKEVKVDIRPIYEGTSTRPNSFKITYSIDGEKTKVTILNKSRGAQS